MQIRTTDREQVRKHIANSGKHKGGSGTHCDFLGDWSEQNYEKGSVRTVNPKRGDPYWILFTN